MAGNCPYERAVSELERWTRDQLIGELREVGTRRYHHLHPFHVKMNAGQLKPEQLRGWVANRYYYQRSIPLKDAAILSNCPLREVRRLWLHRITDHDGSVGGEPGGIEAWLQLGMATGLVREELLDERHVVPGVRFAVDAYVSFAKTQPWPIAVASSLTELFAPDLMKERIAAFERYYTWIKPEGLAYFRSRVSRAKGDSEEALDLVVAHCQTLATQQEAVRALAFKCDLLWAMLDATMWAYDPAPR
jgi:pyrroloquinoline-quinone synthase